MAMKKNRFIKLVYLGLAISQISLGMMRRLTPGMSQRAQVAASSASGARFFGSGSSAYETLSISPQSSNDAVKKQYQQLALKYHPDMRGGNAAKFRAVKEAFDEIMEYRKLYGEPVQAATNDHKPRSSASASKSRSAQDFDKAKVTPTNTEDLLRYVQQQDLNSSLPLISLLRSEGKIQDAQFMKQAQTVFSEKLLQLAKLSIDTNFYEILAKLSKEGFDVASFVRSNQEILAQGVMQEIQKNLVKEKYSSYKVNDLLDSALQYKLLSSVEQFTDMLIAEFAQALSAAVPIKKMSSKLFDAKEEFNGTSFMIELFNTSCRKHEWLLRAFKIYDILVKKHVIPVLLVNDPIQQTVVSALKKAFKFNLEQISEKFTFSFYLEKLQRDFLSLQICVDRGFVARTSFLQSIQSDFEHAIADCTMISPSQGQKLLQFLQEQGVFIQDALPARNNFQEQLLQLIKSGNFRKASDLWKAAAPGAITDELKQLLVNMLLSSLRSKHKQALRLLNFALENKIITVEALVQAEQFLQDVNLNFVLSLFEHCELSWDYENVVRIVNVLDHQGVLTKEQIRSPLTLLMLEKNRKNFRGSSTSCLEFDSFIQGVKYLQRQKLVDIDTIRTQIEPFLSVELLNMLIVKNASVSYYQTKIWMLQAAIQAGFLSLEGFLKNLFNRADLSTEEKERFKAMLLSK